MVQCLTTSIYSAIFHHSIPTLAEPAADKASVHRAFSLTVALVVVFYLMISIPAILYFGADCLSAVNLNWAHYKPQYWQPLAAFVRNFVVFFPALSLVSSYPLVRKLKSCAPLLLHLLCYFSSSPPQTRHLKNSVRNGQHVNC